MRLAAATASLATYNAMLSFEGKASAVKTVGMTTEQLIKELKADEELKEQIKKITGVTPGENNEEGDAFDDAAAHGQGQYTDGEYSGGEEAARVLGPLLGRRRRSIMSRTFDHEYETVTAVFSCAGNEFTAKGKTVLVPGWKEIDQRFRSPLKADGEEETETLNTLPELTEGQSFRVTSTVSEHFTSPPKAYTEDTLLSAMERAGAEDMPEEAERKGLGTPATRAAILEKLVQMGFVQRKGKQLVPTKDGINLAVVLPESLTSPALTAEWENRLTEIAKGSADPDEFMAEIEAQVRQLVKTYSCISADKQNLFQSERVIIGKCPRCSENVYEGKKNFYCGNRSCQFVMWKNDRFFEQRKKAFTPKIAAALLKNGKAKVKGLYSEKTGKTYDATVLLADTGGKYVNYRVERKE